jgi:16S rRNA (guanine527-N7)-methyltransferase
LTTDLLKALGAGIDALQISLSSEQVDQLWTLQNQLLKWNKTYNLTAISDPKEVLQLHLLDSLSLVPYWRFPQTLDVGTGAGFPGLPLAIALPEQQFHLLDSNSKKIRFIRQQVHQLGLKNVAAFHCRVEDHQAQGYDAIVSRAFASLSDMVELTDHLLKSEGSWMAMKGIYQQEEINALPAAVTQNALHRLNVPGLDAERCLIELRRLNH